MARATRSSTAAARRWRSEGSGSRYARVRSSSSGTPRELGLSTPPLDEAGLAVEVPEEACDDGELELVAALAEFELFELPSLDVPLPVL